MSSSEAIESAPHGADKVVFIQPYDDITNGLALATHLLGDSEQIDPFLSFSIKQRQ